MNGVNVWNQNEQGQEEEYEMSKKEVCGKFSHFDDFTDKFTSRLSDSYRYERLISDLPYSLSYSILPCHPS